LLVDTPPELRLQLVRAGATRLDALLFTHTHADHVFGLDDVRVFNQRGGRALPVFGSAESLASIRRQFAYAFTETQLGGGKPQLDLREIRPIDRPFQIDGAEVQPIPVFHGALTVLGFRFGNLAYVTDTNRITPESLALLDGLDVLVLDALRYHPHPTHFSVSEALEVVDRLRPKRTYFTHICHDLEHWATNAQLPEGVELAYDDLVVVSPA
jgi:phosphoribosyl 1,2-cyclic phosphate phosphodiesterase